MEMASLISCNPETRQTGHGSTTRADGPWMPIGRVRPILLKPIRTQEQESWISMETACQISSSQRIWELLLAARGLIQEAAGLCRHHSIPLLSLPLPQGQIMASGLLMSTAMVCQISLMTSPIAPKQAEAHGSIPEAAGRCRANGHLYR